MDKAPLPESRNELGHDGIDATVPPLPSCAAHATGMTEWITFAEPLPPNSIIRITYTYFYPNTIKLLLHYFLTKES
jgi:hypothetical protein